MGFLDVLGAVASPVAGIVGSAVGAVQQNKANKANIKLAREQMNWQEEMWNKQNEYNTPSNQIARLQAAGLNPNLAYGSLEAGNAGQVGNYQRADVKAYTRFSSDIAQSMQLAQLGLLKAQKENVEADTHNKEAGAGRQEAETLLTNLKSTYTQKQIDDFMPLQLQDLSNKVEVSSEEAKNIKEFMSLQLRGMQLHNDKEVQGINQLYAGIAETWARVKNIDVNTDYQQAQTFALNTLLPLQKALLGAQISNTNASTNEITERTQIYARQALSLYWQACEARSRVNLNNWNASVQKTVIQGNIIANALQQKNLDNYWITYCNNQLQTFSKTVLNGAESYYNVKKGKGLSVPSTPESSNPLPPRQREGTVDNPFHDSDASWHRTWSQGGGYWQSPSGERIAVLPPGPAY